MADCGAGSQICSVVLAAHAVSAAAAALAACIEVCLSTLACHLQLLPLIFSIDRILPAESALRLLSFMGLGNLHIETV